MPDQGRDILSTNREEGFFSAGATARAHATKSSLITTDASGPAVKNASFLRLFPVAHALRPSRGGDTCSEGAMKEVRNGKALRPAVPAVPVRALRPPDVLDVGGRWSCC